MQSTDTKSDKGVACYHVVRSDENFEQSARMIWDVVRLAATREPGKPRFLYLDIEGHRNAAGGFDHDMYELQLHFILGFVSPYLTEINIPLAHAKQPQPQREDLPEKLDILPPAPE